MNARTDPALQRLDALARAGLSLARTAPAGRLALARLAEAIDFAWFPDAWRAELGRELEAAHEAACEPLPARTVERELRSAWGGRPTDELDDLDLDPVAVTPTAQVHRGTLDGEPVAVKVLRPGVAQAVKQDLALLDALLRPISAAFPAVDPGALLREVRERVAEELDLEHEADIQRRFSRALRGHPAFMVPAARTDLAREEVLVSEWMDGVPLDRAGDRDAACARLVPFVLGSGRFGIAYADPSPEDVLVLGDGRLAILDFGATRTVDPGRADLVADVVDAFAEDDAGALGAALEALGALPAADGAAALEVVRHTLGELGRPGPSALDAGAVSGVFVRAFERPRELAVLLADGTSPPSDLWPTRGALQLFGAVARAGATGDWLALVRASARHGWDAAS